MSEKDSPIKKKKKIGLLGASFDTGNMGVAALAESSIKVILNRWPDAEVISLGSGREPGEHQLKINDRELRIKTVPIRFCKNIFLPNHFLVLCLYALLFKVFRWKKFKRFWARRNASLNCMAQMDMVADITGGDSFSDIYGMRRFTLGFLRKWLILLFKKDLIMLPQTYGPFKRRLSRAMARYILRRASTIYSRDRAGVGDVKKLLNNAENGKVRFAPDVGFILDARRPEKIDIGILEEVRKKDTTVVGLNVSGLLYNGGYTRDNMFSLKVDYRELVGRIIELLLSYENTVVLLVPHVFAPFGAVESDTEVCQIVYDKLLPEDQQKVMMVKGDFEAQEIKYIIGLCDFFIGSRMHSCIAALSQCIPAVGIAYSKKFRGVFETVDANDFVVDMRRSELKEILMTTGNAFEQRRITAEQLKNTIPEIKSKVLNMLQDLL